MIDYSIAIRKTHPADVNSTETKAYGIAQLSEIMTTRQFPKHISEHGSIYSRDIIQGVILKMVDCLRDYALVRKAGVL